MRVFGLQVWPLKAYGLAWWIIFGLMILLAFGCSDITGPRKPPPSDDATMTRVPSEEEFSANMKTNGIAYNGGVCHPPAGGTVADVHVCFMQLWEAMAIAGGAAATCGSAVLAAATTRGAVAAGSVCSLGLFATWEGLERWVESTEIGLWANQSAEEIANRMRQVIYERMVRRGIWSENAGCC